MVYTLGTEDATDHQEAAKSTNLKDGLFIGPTRLKNHPEFVLGPEDANFGQQTILCYLIINYVLCTKFIGNAWLQRSYMRF